MIKFNLIFVSFLMTYSLSAQNSLDTAIYNCLVNHLSQIYMQSRIQQGENCDIVDGYSFSFPIDKQGKCLKYLKKNSIKKNSIYYQNITLQKTSKGYFLVITNRDISRKRKNLKSVFYIHVLQTSNYEIIYEKGSYSIEYKGSDPYLYK
jgi:hypothetical protein